MLVVNRVVRIGRVEHGRRVEPGIGEHHVGLVVRVVGRCDLLGYEHRLHWTHVIQAAAAAGQITTVRRALIETRRAVDSSIVFALAGE